MICWHPSLNRRGFTQGCHDFRRVPQCCLQHCCLQHSRQARATRTSMRRRQLDASPTGHPARPWRGPRSSPKCRIPAPVGDSLDDQILDRRTERLDIAVPRVLRSCSVLFGFGFWLSPWPTIHVFQHGNVGFWRVVHLISPMKWIRRHSIARIEKLPAHTPGISRDSVTYVFYST